MSYSKAYNPIPLFLYKTNMNRNYYTTTEIQNLVVSGGNKMQITVPLIKLNITASNGNLSVSRLFHYIRLAINGLIIYIKIIYYLMYYII